MKLVGFNFEKIYVERFLASLNDLKVETNIDIKEITEVKQDFFKSKEELIGIKFAFNLDYQPNIAKIEFIGSIVLSLDSKMAKEVLKKWKEKALPSEFRLNLFNLILKKSTLRALRLEEEMNLPTHIPFPSFKKTEEKTEEKTET